MTQHAFPVIDCDLHTIEPVDIWHRYLEKRYHERIPALGIERWSSGRRYDAQSHLQAMDVEGITVAVVFGTHGRHVQMQDDLDPFFAAALARAHNRWTSDYCSHDRRRLKFAAQVSFHDLGLAAAEARRAVIEDGAVAIIGNPTPINGRHIHDTAFDPFWSTLEEVGVPIAFHPTGVWSLRDNVARRFHSHSAGETLSIAAHNPVETMLAVASLTAGGVLERHPGLRCAFLEATCGWVPWWLWRLDETWEKFGRGDNPRVTEPPSTYFRRQCFVATEPDEQALYQVIDLIGDDAIVFASDYPHRDSLFPNCVVTFLGQERLTEATKSKILWDNGLRLYGLTGD